MQKKAILSTAAVRTYVNGCVCVFVCVLGIDYVCMYVEYVSVCCVLCVCVCACACVCVCVCVVCCVVCVCVCVCLCVSRVCVCVCVLRARAAGRLTQFLDAMRLWCKVVKTLLRVFQLRRLWSALGTHLQTYSSLQDVKNHKHKDHKHK